MTSVARNYSGGGITKTINQLQFGIRPERPEELVQPLLPPSRGWKIGTIIDCYHGGCYFRGEVMSLPEENDPEQNILIQFEPQPEGEGTQDQHALSKTQRALDFQLVGDQSEFRSGESKKVGRWTILTRH